MLFYLISILVVLADQAAKWMVRLNMQLGETIPFWNPYVQFTYYENRGAAFSSFQGFGKYFSIVAAVFVVAIFYYRRKGVLRGPLLEAASGFLVGGAIGNAIDRVIFHQVTDFLVFGEGGGIMNLADLAINAGGILIVIHLIIDQVKSGTAKRRRVKGSGSGTGQA